MTHNPNVYGYVNGKPVFSRDEFIFEHRKRGPIEDDAELIAFAEKATSGWHNAGWSHSFISFYLHRAIDDVLALFEVLKAMDDEREDLGSYVNLFGYNPKYGVSGRRIVGVRYEPQSFSKGLTRPEQTLPARVARR